MKLEAKEGSYIRSGQKEKSETHYNGCPRFVQHWDNIEALGNPVSFLSRLNEFRSKK